MEFVIEGTPVPTNKVTFRAEVDSDGDLMLYANNYGLLFIPSSSGKLCRVEISREIRRLLPGLRFDARDRIEVSV